MRSTIWRPIEDEALKRDVTDGLSLQRISVRLNRSIEAIDSRLKFLGLSRPKSQRMPYLERSNVC